MAEDTLTPEGYAKEWLAYAEMDLSTAEFLLGMHPLLALKNPCLIFMYWPLASKIRLKSLS
jgi:hypothetical protein